MKRSPYPLQWPEGRARTKPTDRRISRFGGRGDRVHGMSPYESAKHLLEEMRKLGASHVTITSELPTRNDGLPYSDGRTKEPGIAVWFVQQGVERVFACDVWRSAAENMHAITLSVEAMRGLDRWGMADVVRLAFAGFAALPSGDPETPPAPIKRHWREVLGMTGIGVSGCDPEDVLAIAKARHRRMIAAAHPDAGVGDHALAAEINAALDEAMAELAP